MGAKVISVVVVVVVVVVDAAAAVSPSHALLLHGEETMKEKACEKFKRGNSPGKPHSIRIPPHSQHGVLVPRKGVDARVFHACVPQLDSIVLGTRDEEWL